MKRLNRKDIAALLEEHGLKVEKIDVLKWGRFEYEFGRAQLVASLIPNGHAYSTNNIKQISEAISQGKTFYVRKTPHDYEFGYQ